MVEPFHCATEYPRNHSWISSHPCLGVNIGRDCQVRVRQKFHKKMYWSQQAQRCHHYLLSPPQKVCEGRRNQQNLSWKQVLRSIPHRTHQKSALIMYSICYLAAINFDQTTPNFNPRETSTEKNSSSHPGIGRKTYHLANPTKRLRDLSKGE